MDPLKSVPDVAISSDDRDAVNDPAQDELTDLILRASRGDETAFAVLYEATSARAYGLALRVVRNPAQAEEVVQEAYLDAWRASSRFVAGRGSCLGWLLTIVHRKAVDRVRSSESSTAQDATYHRQSQLVEHDSTAEAAQAALDAQRVRGAVAGLTTLQRETVELAFFDGYTHTEVATTLNIPIGTAKTRIRSGLIRLRDTIADP